MACYWQLVSNVPHIELVVGVGAGAGVVGWVDCCCKGLCGDGVGFVCEWVIGCVDVWRAGECVGG